MINVKKFSDSATLPTRTHPNDAGLDLYSTQHHLVRPGESRLIMIDIGMEIRPGTFGLICDRSSLAKKGIKAASGVIDAGYIGNIGVVLHNLGQSDLLVSKGDRIAQLILVKIETGDVHEVGELKASERGVKGFGSSGQ
jgi:dUTP pyrophosphatase